MHDATTILQPVPPVQKEIAQQFSKEEKMLIDLLSSIIVDNVVKKSVYVEKEMHSLSTL
jgi:hypothetical protein